MPPSDRDRAVRFIVDHAGGPWMQKHEDELAALLAEVRRGERRACLAHLRSHADGYAYAGLTTEAYVLREKADQIANGDHRSGEDTKGDADVGVGEHASGGLHDPGAVGGRRGDAGNYDVPVRGVPVVRDRSAEDQSELPKTEVQTNNGLANNPEVSAEGIGPRSDKARCETCKSRPCSPYCSAQKYPRHKATRHCQRCDEPLSGAWLSDGGIVFCTAKCADAFRADGLLYCWPEAECDQRPSDAKDGWRCELETGSEWGCEARQKLGVARGALDTLAEELDEDQHIPAARLEELIAIARTAIEATAMPNLCRERAIPHAVDLVTARNANSRLHTMAQGNDFANEHELRNAWRDVDDALDELEAWRRRGA